jgi:NitT/TauT family transport system substrate-binding protein
MNQQKEKLMRSFGALATTAALLPSAPAVADDVKVGIGISGRTGFAPLTLATGGHLQEEWP